ncbi:unnamed protein product [Cunninghamella blakesleeana]
MTDKLYTRIFAEKVYASSMSHASEPFASRDVIYEKDGLKELNKCRRYHSRSLTVY